MDTKWKNTIRKSLFWLACITILATSVLGVMRTTYLFTDLKETNGGYNLNDYFNKNSFEESEILKETLRKIDQKTIRYYIKNQKFKGVQRAIVEELRLDDSFRGIQMDVTINYKNGETKKIQVKPDTSSKYISNITIHGKHTLQVEQNEIDDIEPFNQLYVSGYIPYGKDNEHGISHDMYISLNNAKFHGQVVPSIKTIDIEYKIPDLAFQRLKVQVEEAQEGLASYTRDMYGVVGIFLAAVLLLTITISPKTRTSAGKWLDRIWLEVLIFVFISIGTITGMIAVADFYMHIEEEMLRLEPFVFAGMVIAEYMTLMCYGSIVCRIKEHQLLKSLFVYKVLHFTKHSISNQKREWNYWKNKEASTLTVREKELKRKRLGLLGIMISGAIGTFLLGVYYLPFAGIYVIGMIFLFRMMLKDYKKCIQDLLDHEKLLQQIYEISNGNLTAKTDISEESLYYRASKDLEGIGQGMAQSVEEQLKGERMKIDLITNVSHDLKTPLTSIISYVDLLSKDETLSEEARDYVTILNKKSQRLKNIVIDLFDLAKSSSGNATVDLITLDMCKLMEQMLVEMDDKVKESGFEIISQYEVEKALFKGDVNRMYRVVQNIMENALKYSLKGSRIYIRIAEEGKYYKLSIQNTAAYHMNFTEEEIMERFARGDESRTSEGNGLGLSIAESFTQLCGGKFGIRIDGDQFVAYVKMRKEVA